MHVYRLAGTGLALLFAFALIAADKPKVDGTPADKPAVDGKKAEEKPADDKKADAPKLEGDLAKIQGAWSPKEGEGTTYTFTGSKLKVDAPNRKYEITVTLDEKAKPEKSIDLKIDEAPEDAKGMTSKGIYKFDGEKFIICFRAQGDRPEKFEMIGFEQIVLELSKVKK